MEDALVVQLKVVPRDFSKEKPRQISEILVGVPVIIKQVTSQNRHDTLAAEPACSAKHNYTIIQ
jgi:hypothetical protein